MGASAGPLPLVAAQYGALSGTMRPLPSRDCKERLFLLRNLLRNLVQVRLRKSGGEAFLQRNFP
jgi:hypothetical protein